MKLVERELVPAESLVERIASAQYELGIEGVTILGGEPFLQALGLAAVAEQARSRNLSVMVFSGFTLDEILADKLPGHDRLLQFTDVLVDGRFNRSKPDSARNWVGSTNQTFHYMSDRYGPEIESAGEDVPSADRDVEVRISSNGRVVVNGWPFEVRANRVRNPTVPRAVGSYPETR